MEVDGDGERGRSRERPEAAKENICRLAEMFFFRYARLWKSLPPEIEQAPSIAVL